MPGLSLIPIPGHRALIGAPLFMAVLFLFSVPTALASDLSYSKAIDKAGRQRMLTQRIVKNYVQIGLGANAIESNEHLQESVYLFETQLSELKRFAPNRDTHRALERVETLWTPFRRTATSPPDKAGALELGQMDEVLLESCETVVQLLRDAAGDSRHARLVDISGRQRMLSQRLGMLYMMVSAGLAKPWVQNEMNRVEHEFQSALETLIDAPENTSAIQQKLEAVEEQWVWLKSALAMRDGGYYPLIVADVSEKILRIMESLTDMYARLGDR